MTTTATTHGVYMVFYYVPAVTTDDIPIFALISLLYGRRFTRMEVGQPRIKILWPVPIFGRTARYESFCFTVFVFRTIKLPTDGGEQGYNFGGLLTC